MKKQFPRWRQISVLSACLLGLSASLATAQPLAERVPGDALAYVGWRGVSDMGPGYDTSHTKAVIDASELTRFMTEFVPAVMSAEARKNPDEAARLEVLGQLLPTMYKRGGAVFIAQPTFNAEEVTPRLGMLVDAGPDAAALETKIAAMIAANKSKIPGGAASKARVVRIDTLVVALFGYGEKEAGVAGAAPAGAAPGVVRPDALLNDAAFKSALKHVHEKPVLAAYVNSEELLKLVDKSLAARGEAGLTAKQWKDALEAVGLSGVRRAILTGAYAVPGREWSVRGFIEAPAPRIGMAAMLDTGSVSDGLLSFVPANPELLVVGRFDGGVLYTEVRNAAAKIMASMKPLLANQKIEDVQNQALASFDNAVVQVGAMTGVDLKAELFDAAGEEWAIFSDRSIAGGGELGRVLINKPKDPVKLEKALTTLGQVVPGFLALQAPDLARNAQMRQVVVGKDTIRYIDAAPLTPAWLIKDGVLYVAAYPQVIVDTVAVINAKGPSVLTNKDFVAMRKRLGGEKITGLAYADLPQSVERSYPFLMAGARVLMGEGLKRSVPGPVMLVPPLVKLRAELTVSGAVTWADAAGWHLEGITPFPGAEIFAVQAAGFLSGGGALQDTQRAEQLRAPVGATPRRAPKATRPGEPTGEDATWETTRPAR